MAILLIKLLLVPALLATVTLAGRRWGQNVAGWLGSFPIVAGPILLVLTLENGNAFGARLGPQASGYAALFPVIGAIVALIATLPRLHVAPAFAIAVTGTVAMHALSPQRSPPAPSHRAAPRADARRTRRACR